MHMVMNGTSCPHKLLNKETGYILVGSPLCLKCFGLYKQGQQSVLCSYKSVSDDIFRVF